MKNSVRTPEHALLYLTDCLLATVQDMAMKKSKGKWEFERHVAIAQTAIDWLKDFKLDIEIDSRMYQVLSLPDQSVKTWSKSYDKTI